MILWMSAEVMADVADGYRKCRKTIESEVNRLIPDSGLSTGIKEWAYVAILRDEDSADYDEIAKKVSKGKELEFRLKIPYQKFRDGDDATRLNLVVDSLARTVDMMADMGVSTEDRAKLSGILQVVRANSH